MNANFFVKVGIILFTLIKKIRKYQRFLAIGKKTFIRTLNLDLRSLRKKRVEKLEMRIGAENYSELIRANGTLVELIHFLQHSTKQMVEELIGRLSGEIITELIERTIARKQSIGTIHLGLRDLKKLDYKLLEEFEKKVGAENYMKLTRANGTLVEFIHFLQYSTKPMAEELIERLAGEVIIELIERAILEKQSIGTIDLGLMDLKKLDYKLLEEFERKIGAENYLKLIRANGTIVELINILQYSTKRMAKELIGRLNREIITKLIEQAIAEKQSIGSIHWGLRDLKYKNLLKPFENKIGAAHFLRLILNTGNLGVFPDILEAVTDTMRDELSKAFAGLAKKARDKFILKGDFSNFCYALTKLQLAATFEDTVTGYFESKSNIPKVLIARSTWKALNQGLCALDNYQNEQRKLLGDLVKGYVIGRHPKQVAPDTVIEKINFLAVLGKTGLLDQGVIARTLGNITEADFFREADFLMLFRILLFTLTTTTVDLPVAEKVLNTGNNERVAAYLKKEKTLLNILWYLWNLYALQLTVNTGDFKPWLNPAIIQTITVIIGIALEKTAGIRTPVLENKEFQQLLMLIGLLDYWGVDITEQHLSAVKQKVAGFDFSRDALRGSLAKLTFIPAFFYLKGIEAAGNKPLETAIWRLLLPKIEAYQYRTRALEELEEVVRAI
jgi:hypothetical protein